MSLVSRKPLVLLLFAFFFAVNAIGAVNRAEAPIPDHYIVVFNDEADASLTAAVRSHVEHGGGRVIKPYSLLFKGLHVRMPAPLAERISRLAGVRSVEEDAVVRIAASGNQTIANLGPTNADLWGLDRIDQPTPSSSRLNYLYEYCSTGAGVRAYVVDTGVLPVHKEFQGRVDTTAGSNLTSYLASNGISLGPQCWQSLPGSSANFSPDASHGTAVASLIGGRTYGVAKDVTLIDARGVDCGGAASVSTLNKVLEWIPQDPNRFVPGTSTLRPRVVNMSFTMSKYSDPSSSLNYSIQALTQTHNIKVVAAAGNFSAHTFWYTPANSPYAIVAAGLNKGSDTAWAYSNFGATTVYAPAQYVESASTVVTELFSTLPADRPRSETDGCSANYYDTCTSGTSFAAPLTAGVVARYLEANPTATRDQVATFLSNESATHSGVTVNGWPVLIMRDCP